MNAPVSDSPSSSATLRGAAWIACVALVLIASRGLWPIVPVEGDDQGVIFGVEGMVSSSPELLARRYLFPIQPGSYDVLAAAVRLTGVSAQTVFASATVFGAALFAVSGAGLLSAALSIPFVFALLAMLACQETVAAACYLNTSALAGGVALLSLVPFARRARRSLLLLGGVGLGVAGWLRGDALLVAPATLPLLALHDGWGARALRDTALAAFVAIIAFLALRQLSGAPLSAAIATFAGRAPESSTLRMTRDALLTLLSPALLLASLAGVVWLAARKKGTLLLLLAAGLIPTALAYRDALVSTKYLYYTIPFALLPGLLLLRTLLAQRRRTTLALLALAATADAVAGLRVLPSEARFFSAPPAAFSTSFVLGSRTIKVVLGGGDVIPNEDGFRLRTGHLFAAETWRREKLHQQARLAEIRAFVETHSSETLYFAGWLPEQLALRELFAAGFLPRDSVTFTQWHRGTRSIELRFLGHVGSPYQPAGPAPSPTLGRDPLLIGLYGNQVSPTELADGRHWRVATAPAQGFVTLYRRSSESR
ncbi:MAG: hypothetical protein HZA32_01165 [Opitutae bacterium]|nr:hypothetical protein [Opitutae bacterium]